MNDWNRFRAVALGAAMMMAVCCGVTPCAFGQAISHLRADSVALEVISTRPDAADPQDFVVTVKVTIRAGDRPLVIPICTGFDARPSHFCSALLRNKNGKPIRVRKGLEASLGLEPVDRWKPVTVPSGGEDTFYFSFSTGLLDVSPGDSVRVGFEVWPTVDSMKDWKSANTLMSPVFKCPSELD